MDILMYKDDYSYCRDAYVCKIYGFEYGGLCRKRNIKAWNYKTTFEEHRYLDYTVTPRGKEVAAKIRSILEKRIQNPYDPLFRTKSVDDIKDDAMLIYSAVHTYPGMSEAELYSCASGGGGCFFKKHHDEKIKYGIITSAGKVTFRKKEGNKKAGTFDFVSVDFSLVTKPVNELALFVKKHQEEIMRDAYASIVTTRTWGKNEIPISFLQPYSMMITQDKLLHIDFELKEVL